MSYIFEILYDEKLKCALRAYLIENYDNEITYKENQIKLRIRFTFRAADEIKQ